MKELLTISIGAALFCGVASLVPIASAQNGTWTAYPGQSISYVAAIQQPINAEGDSSFSGRGHNVIPIKFALSQGTGNFVFQSIFSDNPPVTPTNDYSFLTFTPTSTTLTFANITALSAVYAFTQGSNCHGGALRWEVGTNDGLTLWIYYGDLPNFTDCTTNSQSGTNMIGLTDLRYDTSRYPGGTFYDTYAHAMELMGTIPITGVSLVLDGGWQGAPNGDQVVDLTSATVTMGFTDTFTPEPASSPTPVCPTAEATIGITKTSTSPSGDEPQPISIQPRDNDMIFRIVDCKYMYNLGTSLLGSTGTYNVTATIDGQTFDVATFSLR